MSRSPLHTFLFADICGYSLLTERDGDDVAAAIAVHFLSEASRLAHGHGADLVKGLGDAVMVHAEDAAASIQLGLDLLARFADDPALPDIHAGLNTGPAVQRAGDWWGATVNVAARVADSAGAGELLITKATRLAAGEVGQATLLSLGARSFKNIHAPIEVYAAAPAPACSPAPRERMRWPQPRLGEPLHAPVSFSGATP
jgi:adenylate cyclase